MTRSTTIVVREGAAGPTTPFGPPPTRERPVCSDHGFHWGDGWSSDGIILFDGVYSATGTISHRRR